MSVIKGENNNHQDFTATLPINHPSFGVANSPLPSRLYSREDHCGMTAVPKELHDMNTTNVILNNAAATVENQARPKMVSKMGGWPLPNALQNALVEAAENTCELAGSLGMPDPALNALYENYFYDWPVLSPEVSTDVQAAMLDALQVIHRARLHYSDILKARAYKASEPATA